MITRAYYCRCGAKPPMEPLLMSSSLYLYQCELCPRMLVVQRNTLGNLTEHVYIAEDAAREELAS